LVFYNGETISRKGGFVLPQVIQSSDFGKQLGCENNSFGVLQLTFLVEQILQEYMQQVMLL
jgi:hypothetical protein